MLYMIARSPSVQRSLQLFRTLHSLYEEELSPNHSGNARLFLNAHLWTAEERLLFLIKLYKRPRTVARGAASLAIEEVRVQALRRDLADTPASVDLFRTEVEGPDNFRSLLHLGAQHFLVAALYPPRLKPDVFEGWRESCIDCLEAGGMPKSKYRRRWLTPFAMALLAWCEVCTTTTLAGPGPKSSPRGLSSSGMVCSVPQMTVEFTNWMRLLRGPEKGSSITLCSDAENIGSCFSLHSG